MADSRAKRIDALAAAVAGGSTVREAALALGMAERTAYRQSASDEFRQRVAALRSAMIETAVAKLTAGMADAADRLKELRKSESAGVALAACKATLEIGTKLREASDFEARLAALEKAINAKKHPRPARPARIPFLRNGHAH
jgi:hypothetical protein